MSATTEKTKIESAETSETERALALMSGVARPEAGDGGDAEFLDAIPKQGVKLNQSTMLLLVVLLIAGGSIYLMRLSQTEASTNGASKEVEARIEQAIAKLMNKDAMAENDSLSRKNIDALLEKPEQVMSVLNADPSRKQVPLEFVQKNPFMLPSGKAVAAEVSEGPAPARTNEISRKIEKELKELKLQSVMNGGRTPVALINNQLVQPGQTLGSFTVKAITGMTVELAIDDKVFKLNMEENPDQVKSRRGR